MITNDECQMSYQKISNVLGFQNDFLFLWDWWIDLFFFVVLSKEAWEHDHREGMILFGESVIFQKKGKTKWRWKHHGKWWRGKLEKS